MKWLHRKTKAVKTNSDPKYLVMITFHMLAEVYYGCVKSIRVRFIRSRLDSVQYQSQFETPPFLPGTRQPLDKAQHWEPDQFIVYGKLLDREMVMFPAKIRQSKQIIWAQ